jgi:hypothetical protein
MLRFGTFMLTLVLGACAPAPAEPPAPSPKLIEGMWSDPPATPEGALCFFACTDEAVAHLNALLDDPANDARPFSELQAEAERFQRENYFRPKLTAAALADYPLDPADDPGFLRCEPWGLARQMISPHQLEIRQVGTDQVELRYGEWEAVRVVYLDGRANPADAPSLLGHSTGRWEGETLVVDTSGVTADQMWWRFRHSDQLRVVERFTRSDDGETLAMTATLEDPWSLREPVSIRKIWRWAPEQTITPYDACEPPDEFSKGTGEP